VCVIGAGLSGLACAFDLARGGADVRVLEASERAGGVAGTIEQDGFRFETGPNTLPASADAFRTLCGDLGIADRLIAASAGARTRYLFHEGRLRALPTGPLSFLSTPLFSAREKLRIASEPLRRRAPVPDDAPEPTASELFAERLGEEPTRLLAGAFVRGIYAGDVDELGARSAFPRLWRMVNEHGGLVRGVLAGRRAEDARDADTLPGPRVARSRLLSFPGGLGELTGALTCALGELLSTGTEVRALERHGDTWRVLAAGGDAVTADAVVLATPVHVAARLLAPLVPPATTAALEGVVCASVTLIHLGFDERELRCPEGFGFLVPPPARGADPGPLAILGAIFASNLFAGRAPAGHASLACFYRSEDLAGLDADTVVARVAGELAVALGLPRAPRPAANRIIAWPRAIPQYRVGHAERMRIVLASLPAGLHLAGNVTSGVGVDPVVARGREVARALLS
jgi:oxygen-dependent protoporphyrinogen oxidase